MFRPLAILLAAACLHAPAAVAGSLCRADVNSTELLIDREKLSGDAARPGLGERAMSWPGRGFDRLTGKTPSCDSQTLIAFLAVEVPARDIAGYCLLPDQRLGYLLVPGERNYRGRCTRTTCDKVNAASDAAVGVAGTAGDIVTRRNVESGQSRTDAVLHASGAAILSGTAANVMSTLGTGLGPAMGAALAAPAMASAAAVSVVAVGGAVYLCRKDVRTDG